MLSPFYDASTSVSFYVKGTENVTPSLLVRSKPIAPTDCELMHSEFERLNRAGKIAEAQKYIVSKLSENVIDVCWDPKAGPSCFSSDDWARVNAVLRSSVFIQMLRIIPDPDIPVEFQSLAANSSSEEIAKKF